MCYIKGLLDLPYVHQGVHLIYICVCIHFSSSETELLLFVLKRAAEEYGYDVKNNAPQALSVSLKLIRSKRPKQSLDVSTAMSIYVYSK